LLLRPRGSIRYGVRLARGEVIGHHLIPVIEPAGRWPSHHHGAHTVLTGLLDRSALYGVLAEIEALGLDLLEVRQLTTDANHQDQVTAGHRDGR
jgi:hypothetical protein